MTALVHPNSFTAGTSIVASEVNANFAATRTTVNGSLDDTNFSSTAGMYAIYRPVIEGTALVEGQATATTYALVAADLSTAGFIKTGVAGRAAPLAHYFDDADYAISGRTQKLRVRAQLHTNATAPTITVTAGLHQITAVAGGGLTLTYTLAAATAGSTVAFVTQGASTLGQGNSGDFTIPGDGHYALGFVLSGLSPNTCEMALAIQLQSRYV